MSMSSPCCRRTAIDMPVVSQILWSVAPHVRMKVGAQVTGPVNRPAVLGRRSGGPKSSVSFARFAI